jgi:hypothetical protein
MGAAVDPVPMAKARGGRTSINHEDNRTWHVTPVQIDTLAKVRTVAAMSKLKPVAPREWLRLTSVGRASLFIAAKFL